MTVEDLNRPQLAEARRERIKTMLLEAGAVTVSRLQARFGVSPMTARRDLMELERRGAARRTHGGAVLPSISAHENSFAQRVGDATEAKIRLADAAFELLKASETIFLDSSSTAYFLARRIAEGELAVRVLRGSI
jgi:DeoR/GlpR family transcriptional regulator of sugar metabolism